MRDYKILSKDKYIEDNILVHLLERIASLGYFMMTLIIMFGSYQRSIN